MAPDQAGARSLFQAAILARRSALDSRLLRSLPRPPSLCESLQQGRHSRRYAGRWEHAHGLAL